MDLVDTRMREYGCYSRQIVRIPPLGWLQFVGIADTPIK